VPTEKERKSKLRAKRLQPWSTKPGVRAPKTPTFVLENDWPDSFYEGEKKMAKLARE
jgi:hypothetical protein